MRSKAIVLLLAAVLMSLQGCDIFQTREPEPPTQDISTFDPPVSPDIVLRNLQFAISEYNVDNYMRCFTDTAMRVFVFIPAQEVRANFESVFQEWDLQAERRYFQNLGQPSSASPLLTLTMQPPNVTADSVVYTINYTLFFPHRRAGVPQVVRGNMQLYLGVDNQRRWSINRWEDFKTTTDTTWSFWKAVFSGS
ncbi:MAG: hypothetical protein HY707_11295 [Ignavibacteriae bacterium]|nr:hypothetical protein [Ignavibacteriota bacterium]